MSARVTLRVRGDPAIALASDAVVAGGASDYRALNNRPSIEGNVLEGDKTLPELGITAERMGLRGGRITNAELERILTED